MTEIRSERSYNIGMRYRLRTLLIVLAVIPPLFGIVPWLYRELDPTVAASVTIWLFVGVAVVLVTIARRDRPA